MKLRYNTLSGSIKAALALSIGLGTGAPVLAQDDDEDTAVLDRVQVTGSRIKRVELEGALPVTVIDRQQIELSGESSAADLLRSLTFNSFGSFRPQSGSSAQGTSSVSLRGIGSSRTLVLVDGRRLPKSPSTGSNQDLNQIPLGAIERVEVLSDGASAIYGSDAIGGVINIITRVDYTGAEIMIGGAEASIPLENGGDREEGSIVFGAANDTTSLIAGVSWNDREIIFAREFPWNPGGASIYGNSFTTITGGFDNFDWTSYGNPAACDFPGTGFFTLPNSNSVNGTRCAYDFTLVSADEASTGVQSIYVKATHNFADDWQFYANGTFSESESFGRYAPVPDSSFFSTSLSPASPNNPTNPDSPLYDPIFGPPAFVNWWHRFDALGNRDSTVTNQITDLLAGFQGYVGGVEVDVGVRRTNNRTDDIGENYLLRSNAATFIEDGRYDLSNPYAVPESILNAMKVTISRISKYDQDEAYVSAAFDVMDLPAGPLQMFVGAETRTEKYDDQYDPLSEAGLVGGSAGNSAGGDRDVDSYYFEALAPLTDTIELSVAGRQDDYSDYGSDFSPKVSLRWQAMDNLVVRASVGEGFRAPSLDILTQKPSFSADSVRDPQSCAAQGQPSTCSLQVNATVVANPSLASEQSDQIAFGIAYEPFEWFDFTLDYYDIEIEDLISSFTSQGLINREQAGDPIPPGLGVVRNPSNGSILNITRGFGNEGTLETSGIDFNGRFNWDLGPGRMTNIVQVSFVNDYSFDGGRDRIGDPGAPEWRAVVSNNYEWQDFTFVWNINAIGDQCDDVVDGECIGHVPTWVTNDLQVSSHAPWDGRITVGVQNVAEKEPPLFIGDFGSRDYDFNLYNAYGRIPYVRYTQTF